MPKIMPIGQSAAAGEAMTHGRKARKYIRITSLIVYNWETRGKVKTHYV